MALLGRTLTEGTTKMKKLPALFRKKRGHSMAVTIYENVIMGDQAGVSEGVKQALEAGQNPGDILNEEMIRAMQEVGRRFEQGECFIPEMLIAARAMQEGLSVLRPYLIDDDVKPVGKIVIGTVKGDVHDIGKNLVGMMLAGAGFEVVDLGIDVSSGQFLAAVKEHKPQFVGLSALLTTTMPKMRTTIDALKDAEIRNQVLVIVGGAPVNQRFANEIGADLYASNAASAAKLAKSKIEENQIPFS